MKIECECGNLIADNTDAIPYKATFIADQDEEDRLEAIESAFETLTRKRGSRSGNVVVHAVMTATGPYQRSLYQCTDCGRLLLQSRQDAHRYLSFTPDRVDESQHVLRSSQRDRWRGVLRGHWGNGSLSSKGGSLWWTCGDGESGLEEFDSWEALSSRYHEVFRKYRHRDVLRSAFLRRDDEMVHDWSTQPAGG